MNTFATEHVWNENSKGPLLEFLKAASECSSEFCNREEYNRLQTLFPLSDDIKSDLKVYEQATTNNCIDITESDEDEKDVCISKQKESQKNLLDKSPVDQTILSEDKDNYDFLSEMIKDNLHIEKAVSKGLLEDLSKLNDASLKKLFSDLVKDVSIDEMQILWDSFTDNYSAPNEIVESYISYLLLPKVKQQFAFELQKIFSDICEKYAAVLKISLLKDFINTDQSEEEINILMQYAASLSNDFKNEIISDFLHTINQLHSNYIPIIQALLNPKVGDDVLNKLIEVMASAVENFTSDNAYGKLLFKAINFMDNHSPALEQPMKRILGGHKSIWKIKIEKLVTSWFNDTLTQSFM